MVRASSIKEIEKICKQNTRKDIMQLKKTESTKSKHRKYISEDSNNRKNKTHQGTHNIKWKKIEAGESSK